MSESATEPTGSPTAEPGNPPRRPWRLMPWLIALALLVLTVAVGLIGLRVLGQPEPGSTEQQLAAIRSQLSGLERRAIPVGNADLTARVDALERRPGPDLSSLQARIADLEKREAVAGSSDLNARLETLERRPVPDLSALQARVATLEQATARADRQSRLQGAALALTLGRPLGDIQGAPAALIRFAHTNPPTLAILRLAFPAAEQATLSASHPTDDERPFVDRLLARIEGLVTIRQGDHVLVGDPAAGILARAKTSLDVGDLSGSIEALSELRGASAKAMAGWLADAIALRDAQTALADMAVQP